MTGLVGSVLIETASFFGMILLFGCGIDGVWELMMMAC